MTMLPGTESLRRLNAGIPGLVWAFRFDASGSAQALREPVAKSVVDSPRGDGWLWLHFSLSDVRARSFIAELDLPARAIETLLASEAHANLHLEGDTAFGALTDWKYDDAQAARSPLHDAVGLGHLHFALTEGLIVSARLHPLRSVESIRRRIGDGARMDSAGHVLEAIIEEFSGAVARSHVEMAEALDVIEDRVLAESLSDERRDLGLLRRKAVRLHRPLYALKCVLDQFEERHRGRSSHSLLSSAARLSQRLDHLDGEVVAMERRAKLLHDEVAAKLAEQTNRQLYTLSVMTAVFLPPTLVFSFFGMNTGGLPLTQEALGTAIAFALGAIASVGVWRMLRRSKPKR